MQNLTVLGAGILGSQIAFQAAYCGKTVVVYDLSPQVLAALGDRWAYFRPFYLQDVADSSEEKLDAAISRIRTTSDLADAVSEADIIIEAVPESLPIKQQTWEQVGGLAPASTIFCSNSSTLLPSDMAPFSGRPEKFLALHFANEIWKANVGEVMGHAGTDPEVFEQVAEFAQEIGMVPIRVHKEQPGYVLNSLLVPLLGAAAQLLVRGVASPEDIDRTWKISTGAPAGPFEIYDVIGMMTPYTLNSASPDPDAQAFAQILKTEYIDKGYLGKAAGRGFYTY